MNNINIDKIDQNYIKFFYAVIGTASEFNYIAKMKQEELAIFRSISEIIKEESCINGSF